MLDLNSIEYLQTVEGLEALYGGAAPASLRKVVDRITPKYWHWISSSRFCVLTTVGPAGTDGSPRGDDGLRSASAQSLSLGFAGSAGETHGGVTRPSCSRVLSQYERGTEIRNLRQLSIVSEEKLSAIADEMGIAHLDPSWIGASVVLRGIPDFSHASPSSRLQNEAGTTLTIDMQNRPCHLPVAEIKVDHPYEAKGFKAAACGRRGVTAWVEREG